jgi:hypothetical protein
VEGAIEQADAADEARASAGASQLIRSVRRLLKGKRHPGVSRRVVEQRAVPPPRWMTSQVNGSECQSGNGPSGRARHLVRSRDPTRFVTPVQPLGPGGPLFRLGASFRGGCRWPHVEGASQPLHGQAGEVARAAPRHALAACVGEVSSKNRGAGVVSCAAARTRPNGTYA